MINEAISVSEFNSIINQTLAFAYPEVIVEGEVASYKINQSKWVFFDLKDSDSVVSCFMPIFHLKTSIEDGMLIRVKAVPQLTKWGKFSLTVKEVELAGEGSVKRAFELLKQQFEKEGLFSEDRKRQIPPYPERILLITSSQAAAFNDFLSIINDRWKGIDIDHIQVQVQGQYSPEQISKAIDYANTKKDSYDVLVLIRGGGSAEDLQAFNTEEVVRAVFSSEIPTIVGIGHEDDVTLAELVADLRAATPTDAARRLVPDKKELLSRLVAQQSANLSSMEYLIGKSQKQLENFYHSMDFRINNLRRDCAEMQSRVISSTERILEQSNRIIANYKKLLNSLDPSAVLARGYSIARVNGSIIKSSDDYNSARDTVVLQLHQGQLRLRAADNNGEDNGKEQTRLRF